MNDCEDVILPALESSLESYSIESEDNHCSVTTPFQHWNGDLIRIWVRRLRGDKFAVSDRGETFAMLRIYGVNPDSSSRVEHVDKVAQQFDVSTKEGEIRATGHRDELSSLILNTIQACQSLSDLLYTHTASSPTQFKTKVKSFLDESGYSYGEDYPVQGETAEIEFDFSINSRQPTVLLDTIHSTSDQYTKQQVTNVMLHWHEIQEKSYEHGVIVDNVEGDADNQSLSRLTQNLDHYFLWSDQDEIIESIPVRA